MEHIPQAILNSNRLICNEIDSRINKKGRPRASFCRACLSLDAADLLDAGLVRHFLEALALAHVLTCARRIDKLSLKSGFPCSLARKADRDSLRSMRELLILVIHLVVTFAKLLQPGGACAVAADLSSAKIESNRF